MRHQQATHGRDRYPKLRILIPARAGSTRIPRKNLQVLIPGKSLLAWCIEFYQRALPGVPIVVATEDHETSKLAVFLKCELHGRCLEDIQDTRDGDGILADLLDCHPGKTILLAQCTSPFTYRSELELALANPLPYVYSAHVGAMHTCNSGLAKSQDIPASVIVTGNFSIARQPFHETRIWSHPQFASPVSLSSAIDINTLADLELARRQAQVITMEHLLVN
jgi:CMP-N-acetylneuraminic acid synthetase